MFKLGDIVTIIAHSDESVMGRSGVITAITGISAAVQINPDKVPVDPEKIPTATRQIPLCNLHPFQQSN
jgi:hypothetical protein